MRNEIHGTNCFLEYTKMLDILLVIIKLKLIHSLFIYIYIYLLELVVRKFIRKKARAIRIVAILIRLT